MAQIEAKTPIRMEEFPVYMVNKLKQKKKRVLVVDLNARTISRRDCIHAAKESSAQEVEEESKSEGAVEPDDVPELRKTVRVSSVTRLVLAEGKHKLKLYLEDSRPHEIIFASLRERERFGLLIQKLKREDTKGKELCAFPARLRIFVTTWNVSSKPPPNVYYGNKPAVEVENAAEASLSYDELCDWIPPQKYDVYVIGLQECKSKSLEALTLS